jgi:hypothetical protein
MKVSHILWVIAALAFALAAYGALAERRRMKRRDLDQVGWVPWTLITVIGFSLGLGAVAFAIKVHY